MMYWSERHGQLLQGDVVVVLFLSTSILFFVVHHLLPVEEPLLQSDEKLENLERLKKTPGKARTLKEALFLVDNDPCRPAVFAAMEDKSRTLLVHRKRLTRSRACVFVNAVLFLPLLIDMLMAASDWEDWLFHGNLAYQVIFAIAAGHYANMLWEDLDSCGNFITGYCRLPLRSNCEKSATLLVLWIRNATCLSIFLMGAMLELPGLGLATLLWEAPLYLTLYREAWTCANELSYWLLDERPLWQFWRPMLLLLLAVRVPLTVLLVTTSVSVELAGDEQTPEPSIRAFYHVATVVLILENFLFMDMLVREYQADRRLAVKMRELGWPHGMSEKPRVSVSSDVDVAEAEPPPGQGRKPSIARLFSFKGQKSGIASDEAQDDQTEQGHRVNFPVCQIGELPSVPKEQDISGMNSICVQSAPRSLQSQA